MEPNGSAHVDPDANLQRIREILKMRARLDPRPSSTMEELCDEVEALDQALSQGARLPHAWDRITK